MLPLSFNFKFNNHQHVYCLEFVGLSTTKFFQILSQTINTINLLDQYYYWVITWWPIPHPLCTNSKHDMLKSPKFEFI